ncbi:hypothetical protein DY000_02039619 [Brassica cretica]|uniref:Uncharacterized protein n=1 Tax=Brassica cretica TaxID=69181 RepID=A0ABQ7BRN4_BRACR|nr:hypothetical protein DY000_02039619 [Brassica cretica]
MHGLMSYRRFGRARSLRSDRAEWAFGCHVVTELWLELGRHVATERSTRNIGYTCKSTVKYREQKFKSPGAPHNLCLSRRGKKQSLALGKEEYGPRKTKYFGFIRTPGLKITPGLLDQNPRVIKNIQVPKKSSGPEKMSGHGKGKPPGSYITLGSNYDLRVQKKTPGSKRPTGPEQPPGSK